MSEERTVRQILEHSKNLELGTSESNTSCEGAVTLQYTEPKEIAYFSKTAKGDFYDARNLKRAREPIGRPFDLNEGIARSRSRE
jgi:hypothetical protein